MKLTYWTHCCFLIETGPHRVVIDPYLSQNPLATVKPEDVKCDYILLTHGHWDHIGDTVQIAKANNATVVGPHELMIWLEPQGVKTHPMGVGGKFDFPFGRVKMTFALHSGGFAPMADDNKGEVYLGAPAGLLVTIEGKTIYHAGDTGLSMEMKLLGELNKIDVAFLPIGDNFTMGPEDAVIAAEFLKPALTVPMHYDTFDLIKQDPAKYVEAVKAKGLNARVMEYGETMEL